MPGCLLFSYVKNTLENLNGLQIKGISLGTKSLTASAPIDVTIDVDSANLSHVICVLDLLFNAPTVGSQYISYSRYSIHNKYRIISSQTQNVQVQALVLGY